MGVPNVAPLGPHRPLDGDPRGAMMLLMLCVKMCTYFSKKFFFIEFFFRVSK